MCIYIIKLLIERKLIEKRRKWEEYIYLPRYDLYSLNITLFKVKVKVKVIFNINKRRLEQSYLT